MTLKKAFTLIFLAFTATIGGCQKLHLRLADASVQKPSNVAVYFTVDTRKGEPVPALTAEQFNIYEDGKLISVYESKQTILNPEVATVRYTLLLLDMSGSIVESGQVPLIQDAVGAFVSNVEEQEQLGIYAFDGRAEIVPIAAFGSKGNRLSNRTARLGFWKTEDPSTNLNGAIVESANILQKQMSESDVPLRFGTLVVFTDGTDRAHRATSSDARKAVRDANINMYVIGLGGEVDQKEMVALGKDGFVHVGDKDAVVSAFENVASQILAMASRYYLLSYCSPSRAGKHRLEVEAVKADNKGRISYDFDAEGFEPDCDPNTPPNFKVPGTQTKQGKIKSKGKIKAKAKVNRTL